MIATTVCWSRYTAVKLQKAPLLTLTTYIETDKSIDIPNKNKHEKYPKFYAALYF